MKKKFQFLTLLFMFLLLGGSSVYSQDYSLAIGARLGSPISVSAKLFISDNAAVEAFANYRGGSDTFLGTTYRWSFVGVGAGLQFHNPIDAVDGLYYYYGGGASVWFYNYANYSYYDDLGTTSISLQGYAGLDYKFENTPINLSLDWTPIFFIGSGYYTGFGARYGALSVRYVIK